MALQFPTSKWAHYPNANWLDNVDSFSLAGWVRFDTVTTGNKQFVFSHKGSTNKFSLRKDSTTDNWKFSVTAGGVNVLNDVSGVVATTKYHVACTWLKNSATGQKIYVNGSLLDTDSTTSQTANYDSGGGSSLIWASETDGGSNFGVCTLEGWSVWPGVVLTLADVTQHRFSAWPSNLSLAAPGVFYPFQTGTTEIKDWSGNKRHITSVSAGTSHVVSLGKWERPTRLQAGTVVGATTTTPPAPAAWTRWPTPVAHPGQSLNLTGLTNNVAYEVRLIARDTVNNESTPSATSEATPTDAVIVHRRRRRLIG